MGEKKREKLRGMKKVCRSYETVSVLKVLEVEEGLKNITEVQSSF